MRSLADFSRAVNAESRQPPTRPAIIEREVVCVQKDSFSENCPGFSIIGRGIHLFSQSDVQALTIRYIQVAR